MVRSDRFTAITISNWLLIMVYMPCIGTHGRNFLYYDTFSELDSLISAHSDYQCIVGSDFNTDLDCNVSISVDASNFISNNLESAASLIDCFRFL